MCEEHYVIACIHTLMLLLCASRRVSWCLPCGITAMGSVLPYFYCLYFASLLIHRERRDDQACRKKYGKDWDKYCQIVKWRIIPYVY